MFTCYISIILIIFNYTDPLILEFAVSGLEEKVEKLEEKVEKLEATMAQLYNRIDKTERTSYIPPYMYNSYHSIPPPIQPSTVQTDVHVHVPPYPPSIPPPIHPSTDAILKTPPKPERHVKCLPIKIKDTTVVFSSSLIIIENMVSAKTTLQRYPRLVTENKVGQLASWPTSTSTKRTQ